MATTYSTISPVVLSNTYDLSCNGSMYLGGWTALDTYNVTLNPLHLLKGFKTGSISFEGQTVDNSTRDDQGWTSDDNSTRSATLSVTFNKISRQSVDPKNDDPEFDNHAQEALRELILSNEFSSHGIGITFKSNSDTGSGNSFSGVFVMTSMSESQQQGAEAVEVQCEFKSFGQIYLDTDIPNEFYVEMEKIDKKEEPDPEDEGQPVETEAVAPEE